MIVRGLSKLVSIAAVSASMLCPLVPADAQTSIANNGVRMQSFDTAWKFIIGTPSNAQAPGYSDASWQTVNVPHDYALSQALDSTQPMNNGYLNQTRSAWYRKTFTLPSGLSGSRIFVSFDGVYNNSTMWINGNELGNWPSGTISFQYDLTPYLNFGSTANVLAVQLAPNYSFSTGVTSEGAWWYVGNGIYRHVWLAITNPVYIPNGGVYITTPVAGASSTVNLQTTVANQSGVSATVIVETALLDNSGAVKGANALQIAIPADSQRIFSQTIQISGANLWSIDTPVLYTAVSSVYNGSTKVDSLSTPFGIRSIRFDANQGFFLNNNRVGLKGVTLHNDLGCLGVAVSNRGIRRQLAHLKSMGCNAIRTSHNTPAPELLADCDSMGFVVLDEGICRWDLTSANDSLHAGEVRRWILRDRNHPCVILWGCGNEDPNMNNSSGTTALTKILAWAKPEDTTRPYTWATNLCSDLATANSIEQQNAALLGVVGSNYCETSLSTIHSQQPNFKLLQTEVGSIVETRGVYHWSGVGDSAPMPSSSTSDNHGSDFDNQNVKSGWPSVEGLWFGYGPNTSYAYEAGMFIWSGFDYLGEPWPYSWPNRSSTYGLFDLCGFPKQIYWGLKSEWVPATPLVHIFPHWNWATDSIIPVRTYSNCTSVELFLNGVSKGAQTLNPNTSAHLQWNVPWQSGTLTAVGKIGGVAVAWDTVRTAGPSAKIQLIVDDSSTISADGYDVAFIETVILDTNGVDVPKAKDTVTYTVTGPGTLIGTSNGDETDHTLFSSVSHAAFNGKCLAVIRSQQTAGAIVVTASAHNLTSASTTIQAQAPVTAVKSQSVFAVPAAAGIRMIQRGDLITFVIPPGFAFPSARLILYNMQGRNVREWHFGPGEKLSVSLTVLPQGIYCCKLIAGSREVTRQLVKVEQ